MKTFTKLMTYAFICVMLCVLVACGGGSGTTESGSTESASSYDDFGTGVGVGAESEEMREVAWEDLSPQDQVYRLMDVYPLMFNGVSPKELPSRRGVNKGLGNIKEKANPSDYVIGHSGGSMSSPYFINLIESTTATAEAFGFTVLTQLNAGNSELRYQQLDAFITQGVDGLMASSDPTTSEPYFRRAAEAGIPVIATSAQMMRSDNPVITNILGSGIVSGFLVGEYMAEYMVNVASEKRPEFKNHDYVWQCGHAIAGISSGESQSRNAGIYSGMLYWFAQYDGNPYPDKWSAIRDGALLWARVIDSGKVDFSKEPEGYRINVRGYGSGGWDAPGGQTAVQDLIVAHPDIDMLFFDCDPMFPGGEVVLSQNGKIPGENIWCASAADGTPYCMEKILLGEFVAIGNNSSEMNAYGMASCMRDIFLTRRDMDNIIPNTYTPTVAITIENIWDYYDPNKLIARGIPYELEDIDHYNARMAEGLKTGDPFYHPGYYIASDEWRNK